MKLWHLEEGNLGGQGMGKTDIFGNFLLGTRIGWEDVPGGVHYHYEIVIGSQGHFYSNIVNKKI